MVVETEIYGRRVPPESGSRGGFPVEKMEFFVEWSVSLMYAEVKKGFP